MKKQMQAIFAKKTLTLLIITLALTPVASAAPWQGLGTESEPYLIQNANDLLALGDANNTSYYSDHFKLMADIDLASQTFTTALIAPDTDNSNHQELDGTPFTGVFDGNNHKIFNLTIDTNGVRNYYLGLFGWIGTNSRITDLGVEDVNIISGLHSFFLGGLAGWNDGTISDCYSTGSVSGGEGSGGLGGLAGYNNGGTISNCYSTVSVTGGKWAGALGGLCGSGSGTISNCYATGDVTGDATLGGLVGGNYNGEISNCYATGSVKGSFFVAGLAGYNEGTISNSYSTGSITGGDDSWDIGGLAGLNYGTISNCYATGSIMGGASSSNLGGLAGGNDGTISNCYATGSVTGGDSSNALGGLAGVNRDGDISNCYSTGNVTGDDYLGGLCGVNPWNGTISNSYSTGSITGGDDSSNLGGLCGFNWIDGPDGSKNEGSISSCFWDVNSSGMTTSAGGTGLDTIQMQTLTTFTDAGWDFVTPIWLMCNEGEYPKLSWQGCNSPPLAIAGPNQTVYAYSDGLTDVTLDGADSNDPDGDDLTYLWVWTIDSNDYDTNSVDPTIDLPVGEHTITLVVNDGFLDSEPDQLTVTVIEPIQASKFRMLPQILNRTSRGKYIIAILRLPQPITRDQVSNEKLLLYSDKGDVEAVRQFVLTRFIDDVEYVSILALFDRTALLSAVPENGRTELEVHGTLNTGQIFYGTDTIKIIDPRNKPKQKLNRPSTRTSSRSRRR